MFKRLQQQIARLMEFLGRDLWRLREGELPRRRWVVVRILRVLVLAVRGLVEDKCQIRARSLTFYSLLSIVPIAAMLFGIAKGFGFEKTLERELMAKLEGQAEIVSRVISFAEALLENTRGGLIAGIGVLLLFWTIVRVLSNIESSFNDIWGVRQGRSWARKISDYLSLMLICPVLFLIASAMTVVIASQINSMANAFGLEGALRPGLYLLGRLAPYVVFWILFVFLYLFMPNTRVRFMSGLIGGLVAGTLFQFFQLVYIQFQVSVSSYNAIYGSFAALPLFLIWLQFSWLIVLFGAEIAFAHQNADTYEFEPDCLKVSRSFKRLLTLCVAQLVVKRFDAGAPAMDDLKIAQELEVPIRLVRDMLFDLTQAGILLKVQTDVEREATYQPGMNPERMTLHSVLNALDIHGSDDIPVGRSPELGAIGSALQQFDAAVAASPANRRLLDI